MHSKQQLQQILKLYLNKRPQDYQKRVWPTFGSKVGQSVLVAMKLELDVYRHLLAVYTKFQIYISKHIEKKPGKLKEIAKIPKMGFLIYEAGIAKMRLTYF